MRTKALRGIGAVGCALALLGGVESNAAAQSSANPTLTPALALDRFYPAPPGDRMFGVESPEVAERATPRFSAVADYAHDPLVLQTVRTNEDRGRVIGDQLFLHLQAAFAIKTRVYVSASFPVALLQDGGSPVVDGSTFTSPAGAAIGDLRFGIRLRLFGLAEDPLQMAVAGYLWIPTGSGEAGSYVSDGSFRGLPRLLLGGRVGGRFVWGLNGGIDVRSPRMFGGNNGVAQGTMGRLDGGIGFLFLSSRALQIGVEGSAAFLLKNETNVPIEHATNLEALLGAKYRFLDFEIGAGMGPGLTSGIGTPDIRAIGSIAYLPSAKRAAPRPDPESDRVVEDRFVEDPIPVAPPKAEIAEADTDGIPDALDVAPAPPPAPPPPEPAIVEAPKSVVVTNTEIVILQEVQFDSARSSIKMVSFPLLDAVASALKRHPEIALLEVQGHTDNQGKPDYNKRLSQERADSVRTALIQRGIGPARLMSSGYGQDKPLDDNLTMKGREKNRRVQFVIVRKQDVSD